MDSVEIFVADKWVDSDASVKRHSKSTDFEDGLEQWFIEHSYSLCSSLRETAGGKKIIFAMVCSIW